MSYWWGFFRSKDCQGESPKSVVVGAFRVPEGDLAGLRQLVSLHVELVKGFAILGHVEGVLCHALFEELGHIAAVLVGNLWNQIDAVLRHWMDIAPIFIKRYETLSEWSFNTELQDFFKSTLVKYKILIEVLGKAADQYTCYVTGKGEVVFTMEKGTHEYRTIDPWTGLIKMLDRSFFNEITKGFIVSETARSINMVKSDPALIEGWLKWFEMEEERLKMLKKARRYLLNDHE